MDPASKQAVLGERPHFNESDMVFIPKLPDGEIGAVGDVRPISIASGENRILANAFRYPFVDAMKSWVSAEQRGFLPGRDVLQNILEIDC
eukprot:2613811-Lingulodinium_polyedra.AAC.1